MALLHPRKPEQNDGWVHELTEICKSFSEEEINVSVWGLEEDKEPEPDGFPVFFYRVLGDRQTGYHQTNGLLT